jgi:hypothetical protein
MVPYVNTHTQLEARRDQALTDLMAGGTAIGPGCSLQALLTAATPGDVDQHDIECKILVF